MGDVQTFVDEHSDAELLPNGKVLCKVTQHELPANLDLVVAHWSGKKYATKKAQSKYDFSKHEPWIIPHRKSPDLLYCTLTRQALSRQPKTVEGHVNGKKCEWISTVGVRGLRLESRRRAADPPPKEGRGIEGKWGFIPAHAQRCGGDVVHKGQRFESSLWDEAGALF